MKKILMLGLLMLLITGCAVNNSRRKPDSLFIPSDKALTAAEAAAIGRQRAQPWSKVATLWYLNPTLGLSDDWATSGKSSLWGMLFVDPANKRVYHVDLRGERVTSEGLDPTMIAKTDYQSDFPLDAPLIDLPAAAQTVFEHGAPRDSRPTSVIYSIDNTESRFRGAPVWEMTFANMIYYVDALSGDYLGVKDLKTGTIKENRQGDQTEVLIDDERIIRDFFLKINDDDFVGATFMLADALAPDDLTKRDWANQFSQIADVTIDEITKINFETWPLDERYYKVKINIALKPEAIESDWIAGEQTRLIALKKNGQVWQIFKIEK
jgi:hypothetical protein